jgi:tellurite resistance protein TerC
VPFPPTPAWVYAAFFAFVAVAVVVDLFVLHRKAHVVSLREAGAMALGWVSLAVGFNLLVWWWRGPTAALEFATGYLIEGSLSVDNLFVFLVIFKYFALPLAQHHRVLVWGILGAVLMRGLMIFTGAALVARFEWILDVFGALLVFAAVKLARQREGEAVDPRRNVLVRLARTVWPVTPRYHGGRFFVRLGRTGRLAATPLLLVVLMVESTDVIFAVDSIPAIFAITRDPFIVFTSNIFAILGLRAIFFLLAGVMHRFRYLRYGLAVVLGFIGLKMLAERWVHVPILLSLGFVGAALSASVGLSLLAEARERRARRR